MKILVIGSGGREHALVKSFAQSPSVNEVHVAPGNDGMKKEATCHPIPFSKKEALLSLCKEHHFDFVFIGPEDPLVDGLSDFFRRHGILCVGPEAKAAQLEGSKIFAKEFMIEAQVPTATYQVVRSVEEVKQYFKQFTPPYVLKADGLAAGKGVFICDNENELFEAAENLFQRKILGSAGEKALLEQFKSGWELSYLVLTNGEKHVTLPLAQDHKRLLDGQKGPNTGGMGTIAPMKIPDSLREQIETSIVQPTIKKLNDKKLIYRGVLFVGIMVTDSGPQVLEYNVRFGDPETQVILPLLDTDTGVLFKNLSLGKLDEVQIKKSSACCVILAAHGYPDSPRKGDVLEGPLEDIGEKSYFVHAGTKKMNSLWVTNGGRVLGAVGVGQTPQESIKEAYLLASKVHCSGLQFRTDIGQSQIK